MGKTDKSPPYLKKGDKVIVVASSGFVDKDKTEAAIKIIEAWGLTVVRAKNLYKQYGIFAGNDEERLTDLQWALNNPDFNAIIFARGGYGLSRIIKNIDFTILKSKPKWIAGFSDISLLHYYIGKELQLPVVHSEMLLNFSRAKYAGQALSSLRDALFSGVCSYQWNSDGGQEGECRGVLTGGNLSMLCTVAGDGLAEYLNGKILFIEETGEDLYKIDRLLLGLKNSGVFSGIIGLVLGGMSDIPKSEIDFGYIIKEIVLNSVSGRALPVAFDFPAGHIVDNRALIFGREYFFRVDPLSAVLSIY